RIELLILDEERVGVDVELRVTASNVRARTPVSAHPPSVEETRGREAIDTGTYARDAPDLTRAARDPCRGALGHARPSQACAAGHDEGVELEGRRHDDVRAEGDARGAR